MGDNIMLDVTLKLLDAADGVVTGGADLAALRRQLNMEPDLRGRVRLESGPPAAGQMGTGIELLAVAIGSSGAITALIRSLPALLKARRSAASVELSLPDGRNVKVTADSADDAHTLLNAALRNQPRP
ncbi:effector-associated constant component EACC1 [Streptomyces rubrogriseus]|uniref:effector-associated constant component EACC1 n=1 Tax=Streptomyces rubrogriseus TaxID=194673 RepID=UPI00364EE609